MLLYFRNANKVKTAVSYVVIPQLAQFLDNKCQSKQKDFMLFPNNCSVNASLKHLILMKLTPKRVYL